MLRPLFPRVWINISFFGIIVQSSLVPIGLVVSFNVLPMLVDTGFDVSVGKGEYCEKCHEGKSFHLSLLSTVEKKGHCRTSFFHGTPESRLNHKLSIHQCKILSFCGYT